MALLDDYEFPARVLKAVSLPAACDHHDSALETDALPEEGRYVRRSAKRTHLHLLQVKNAAKHIGRLPDEGESIHAEARRARHHRAALRRDAGASTRPTPRSCSA